MLSLILPTFNEADNLPIVLAEIKDALQGISFEVIVVDDNSPDGTAKVAEQWKKKMKHLHVIKRKGKRGLALAVVEGFHAANGAVLAVMDADGQHDPTTLRALYELVQSKEVHVAIASRFTAGGSTQDFRKIRLLMSKTATVISRPLYPSRVSDPLSGFFAIDRETWQEMEHLLRPKGFKILLEILVHLSLGKTVTEVPLNFGLRKKGDSKLGMTQHAHFLSQLFSLAFRGQRGSIYLFGIVCLVITSLLLPRVWDIHELYTDGAIRTMVRESYLHTSQDQGWLLSNMLLQNVSESQVQFTHREHRRGNDPETCYFLSPDTFTLAPCA